MRVRRLTLTLITLLLAAALAPRAHAAAGAARVFPETGHSLAYAFREHFDAHGGLSLFGYPITEVFLEDGRPVQYFERARMEWHADLGLVLLGHLGRWSAAQLSAQPPFQPIAPEARPPDQDFFRETGHALGGAFRAYWASGGGLPVFGFPLSEAFVERNAEDGREYTVQYFERARFELHPDLPAPYRVSLGHLGRQYLRQHAPPNEALQPVANPEAAWAAVRPTRITIERIGLDTPISAAGFSLNTWDVPRYTAAHYWPVAAYPGTAGNIIMAGHVGYRDIIFSHLPQVQAGDEIVVYVGAAAHRYRVRDTLTVLPSETWVMQPTATETLTLITCVPLGVYSHRLIVRADPIP